MRKLHKKRFTCTAQTKTANAYFIWTVRIPKIFRFIELFFKFDPKVENPLVGRLVFLPVNMFLVAVDLAVFLLPETHMFTLAFFEPRPKLLPSFPNLF